MPKATKRNTTPSQKSYGDALLADISRNIALLNSAPSDDLVDPGFAFGEAISQLAAAMANIAPNSPAEALAQACLAWEDLEALNDASDLESYKARSAMRRLQLRIFFLAGWIENQHRIRRKDWNLDYFHSVENGYRRLFPHKDHSADIMRDLRAKEQAVA